MKQVMFLPRATQFTLGALVVALLGWGILIYSTSTHNDAAERWAQERQDLDQRVLQLTDSGASLEAQVAELEGTLAAERAAAGDLTALRAEIAAASGTLSARMATLGERERQIVAADDAVAALEAELGEVEGRIERAKGSLNQRLAVLGERERDLAATRRAQDRLDDEIAAAEARFAQLGGRLSARMGVLGERDRELAESSQALAALQQRADAEEARHAAVVARLNQRLARLGAVEREMVDGERALHKVGTQAGLAAERLAGVEALLTARQTAQGGIELAVAEAQRALGRHEVELTRAGEALAATHAELAAVRGTLDHALLAQDVAGLGARQTELSGQLAVLDEEIARKGPLAASALSLSQRVADLEGELLELTRERDRAALTLRETAAALRLADAESARAAGEREQIAAELALLREQRSDAETTLAGLSAEVRHQESVFATLEVLKKEHDFLRGLIGTMVAEGHDARQQVDQLRMESAALLGERLAVEKELVGKQAEVELLDKAILAKGAQLGADAGVSSARAF